MKKQYPFGTGIVRWISTDWLEQHLHDENLTILDVQPNVHDYIQEHIPGAIYLNEGLWRGYSGKLPTDFVTSKSVREVLSHAGLKNEAPVAVYTGTGPFKNWGDGLEQTMMAYALVRYGHKNVFVVDGGIDKWKAEGKKLSQEFPRVRDSEFEVVVQNDFYIEYNNFRMLKDRADTVLIDARPPDVYQGKGPWIKAGHIPGAINVPWRILMNDKNPALLKPEKEIREILSQNGVIPEKRIICSCGTGREATNQFILLKYYFGYTRVKIYEGSFTEWTSYPENPTVIGPHPY